MGRIREAVDLTRDVEIDCDVCVVGSGAGGAVVAERLARAGARVVILEAGPYGTRRDFTLRERDAFDRFYQDGGARATSDQAIAILQGRSVGGSTTVNWTTCFRTPRRILDHWREVHGVETLSEAALSPHWEAIEARLNIHEWRAHPPNRNNGALERGCAALGWETTRLRRNVRGCANSGYCGQGCPVDGKQAMHVTYLPDALALGADLYADVRVERLEHAGGRISAVHGVVLGPDRRPTGIRVQVRPRLVVCAGGAINSPALLLASGLARPPVGRRTFLHPVVGVVGEYPEPVDPWFGAPQTVASHAFVDRGPDRLGFFIEAAPMQPMLPAAFNPRIGRDGNAFMGRLRNMAAFLALCVDGLVPGDEGGSVRWARDGRLRIDYPLGPLHEEVFREATARLVEAHLAAGAIRATTLHVDPIVATDRVDLDAVRAAPYGAHEHPVFSAHQMGGCPLGPDPATSVVDPWLRHHDVDNLFVVDGSVLPTALGVNPSLTVLGIASWAASHVVAALG